MIAWLLACAPDAPVVHLAPHADAGPDVVAAADARVELDGRGSTDPEGDALEFLWRFDTVPDGSDLVGRDAAFVPNGDSSGRTTFRPDKVGVYVVELVVWDGRDASAPDTVLVDVGAPVALPLADAGTDVVIGVGDTATLDGNGSIDPQGADLAYAWSLIDAPANSALGPSSLAGADSATPSFVPDAIGDYTLALVVTGGFASSLPDAVRVRAIGADDPPVASAGADQTSPECTYVALGCAGADPENAPLSYFWNVESVPEGSLASRAAFGDPEAGTTTFLPDVRGLYELSCSAWDGTQWSLPDTTVIDVTERTGNDHPEVDAGNDRNLTARPEATCHPVETGWSCDECPAFLVDLGLDGAISDPNNDPFTVEWTVVEDPDAGAVGHGVLDPRAFPTLGRIPAMRPRFPGSCIDVEYKFRVTATDCPGDAARDTVAITAHCCGAL